MSKIKSKVLKFMKNNDERSKSGSCLLHYMEMLTLINVALPPFVSFFRFSLISAWEGFLFCPDLLASLSFCLFSFSLIFSLFAFLLSRLSRFLSVDVFSVLPTISPALFFSCGFRGLLLDRYKKRQK